MSCFAVSRLTGRVGRSKQKERSPCLPDLPTRIKQKSPSKRKSGHSVPKVEIVQELPVQLPATQQQVAGLTQPHPYQPALIQHHRDSSLTPVPPSSPQPSPYPQHYSPYFHYGSPQQSHQINQQRHMSPIRNHSGSVPPSPNLNGMRSPSRQRKNVTTYSTLEVRKFP